MMKMFRMQYKLPALGFAVLLAALPALAHHSFATEYDSNKPATLKGTVTKVDLKNPDSWLYINVKDQKGNMVSWGIEMPPPYELSRQEVHKNTIPIGIQVTVEGFLAKNGSNVLKGKSLKFPDGRTAVLDGLAPDPVTLLDKPKILPQAR